ncbi:IclR family transcriptional regulator [Sediminicoccus sp. KRV36]|uniref:IclR family transcriptional regulator n=1 Tax=Sediminicoccus sp. KRV36 TaxID=3133721 RepID=UPI00200FD58B|nr:IclR family transcriptional regulator [Sediminicoccus rosea]UPY38902.1 IclR family transcriptional regulator [Sediminicoccus rosea]
MDNQPASTADGARVVRRAVSLLREVSAARGNGATLKMLADSSGLPQPTAHRLLKVLQAEGLLERDTASRAYRLGSLLYEFGLAAVPRVDARRLCAGTLERITRAVGDTTYLNSRSGNDALCLDRREGSFEIRALPIEVGNRRPLGVGAGALAVLASLPSTEAEAVIEANAKRYRRHGLTAERIRTYVEATRARGFAITSGRIVARYRGVAIAVGNGIGGVPASLSVVAVAERLDPRRIEQVARILIREEKSLREMLAIAPAGQTESPLP